MVLKQLNKVWMTGIILVKSYANLKIQLSI